MDTQGKFNIYSSFLFYLIGLGYIYNVNIGVAFKRWNLSEHSVRKRIHGSRKDVPKSSAEKHDDMIGFRWSAVGSLSISHTHDRGSETDLAREGSDLHSTGPLLAIAYGTDLLWHWIVQVSYRSLPISYPYLLSLIPYHLNHLIVSRITTIQPTVK